MDTLPEVIDDQREPVSYEPKRSAARIALVLHDIGSGYTVTAACKRAGIHPTAWGQWVEADEALASAYAQARAVGADVMADECIAIADGELPSALDYRGHVDTIRAAEALERSKAGNANPTGSSYITRLLAGAGLEIARDRMRIDTRLKLLAQWDDRYSPKQRTELTGKGGGPIQLEDKGDAIALAAQLRDMKRARVRAASTAPGSGQLIEHDAGGGDAKSL